MGASTAFPLAFCLLVGVPVKVTAAFIDHNGQPQGPPLQAPPHTAFNTLLAGVHQKNSSDLNEERRGAAPLPDLAEHLAKLLAVQVRLLYVSDVAGPCRYAPGRGLPRHTFQCCMFISFVCVDTGHAAGTEQRA